ncbi:hypothetical protein J6590_027932 [Homalodisca vitripennis]|nr:hypothetical protein J6590_027932 [Homalodisca vitripennis]
MHTQDTTATVERPRKWQQAGDKAKAKPAIEARNALSCPRYMRLFSHINVRASVVIISVFNLPLKRRENRRFRSWPAKNCWPESKGILASFEETSLSLQNKGPPGLTTRSCAANISYRSTISSNSGEDTAVSSRVLQTVLCCEHLLQMYDVHASMFSSNSGEDIAVSSRVLQTVLCCANISYRCTTYTHLRSVAILVKT